jgi:hypothetical protein
MKKPVLQILQNGFFIKISEFTYTKKEYCPSLKGSRADRRTRSARTERSEYRKADRKKSAAPRRPERSEE